MGTLGEVGEVLATPLRVTETVSILPAPLGPSMVSVSSDLISPLFPALTLLLDRSQGIGVSSAPPRLSSLPSPPLVAVAVCWEPALSPF